MLQSEALKKAVARTKLVITNLNINNITMGGSCCNKHIKETEGNFINKI